MRIFRLALVQLVSRRLGTTAFTACSRMIPSPALSTQQVSSPMKSSSISISLPTRVFSSFGGEDGPPMINHIGKEQMEEIIEDYEEGREESGYVVIDVRDPDEIAFTGKVSPNTHNIPLGVLVQYQVFSMDDDDFEDTCGFPKPSLDETLVFTCAAGIRSTHACNFAAQGGYSNLVNYRGGANEWFAN